jgi:hypothetical protein
LGLVEHLVGQLQHKAGLASTRLRGKTLEDWDVQSQLCLPTIGLKAGDADGRLRLWITRGELIVDVAAVRA